MERLSMDKLSKAVHEWINKAENDYLACTILLDAPGYPADVVAFHLQQTVEKYLKAILVLQQKRVKKIHDLEALLLECSESAPELPSLIEDVLILDSYGPETRYPGLSDIFPEDIPGLLEKTSKIRSVIRGHFEREGIL